MLLRGEQAELLRKNALRPFGDFIVNKWGEYVCTYSPHLRCHLRTGVGTPEANARLYQ